MARRVSSDWANFPCFWGRAILPAPLLKADPPQTDLQRWSFGNFPAAAAASSGRISTDGVGGPKAPPPLIKVGAGAAAIVANFPPLAGQNTLKGFCISKIAMLGVAVPGFQTVPRAEAFAVGVVSSVASPSVIENFSIDAVFAIRGVAVVSPKARPDHDVNNARVKFLTGKNGDIGQTCAEELASPHASNPGTSKAKSHQGLGGVVSENTPSLRLRRELLRRRRHRNGSETGSTVAGGD